jgi:tetratricopeptide (TPR) repeat protein
MNSARLTIHTIIVSITLSIFGVLPAFADLQDDLSEGYSLIDQWKIKEADAYASTLLQKYADSGDVYFLIGRIEFFKGNYGKAMEILKEVSDNQPIVKEFKNLVNKTYSATSNFVFEESEHFRFAYVDGSDRILVHYAKEALEKSYQVLGKLFNFYPSEKILVEFYPNHEPFSQISPLTFKDIMTSGTVALCKYNRIMMISPGALVRGYNWMDTLSHEFTHYILSAKSNNNVPLWLHEGIAKYLESRWRENREYLNPLMKTVLASGLSQDYMVSLEAMMPSLAKLKTAEEVQLAYAEVATMVDYMIELKGEEILADITEDFSKELSIDTILENRLGKNLEEFQKSWKSYVKGKNYSTIPGLKAFKFRFKNIRPKSSSNEKETDTYKEVVDTQAQNLTRLGDILKSRNYLEAATVEYEKAIKESKSISPILNNKLATAYLLRKSFDKAESLLIKNVNSYPYFATTEVNLGELYYLKGNFETSLKHYKRAVHLNPFNPYVHSRMIDIMEKLELDEEKDLQVRLFSQIE